MEEASIAFTVDGAEEVSDEEDDDIQRKQELHQLLTEQLQDDLLDDSVSTVTTEDGVADSTLLVDEMGVSLDHMISPHQSCDLVPHGDNDDGVQQMISSGCGQNGRGLEEMSDVFSGTAQAYSLLHSQPESDITSEPSQLTKGHGQLEVLYNARCRQVSMLSQQLQEMKQEQQKQERILRHEKSLVDEKLRLSEETIMSLESQTQSLNQQLTDAMATIEHTKKEREEICNMIHPTPPEDVAKRLVELSTEKEDLQYQLSCCQGQLEAQIQRAEAAEMKLSSVSEELSSMATEVTGLRSEVKRLISDNLKDREMAEIDKKDSLEKCRNACLKLHEDSSQRIKETMATEKQHIIQEYDQKIVILQAELTSAQEEYMRVCKEKDKMESQYNNKIDQIVNECKTRVAKQQALGDKMIKDAVEKARDEWRQSLAHESRQCVEKALTTAKQQWQERLSAVKEEESIRRESEIMLAVEESRQQWQVAQDNAIQVAVDKAKQECLHSKPAEPVCLHSIPSEPVLTASQVHSMLQATMTSVKSDVRQMLQEVLKVGEERERQSVARARLTTAQEMKTHYLSCLHMMINNSQTTTNNRSDAVKEKVHTRTNTLTATRKDGYHGKGQQSSSKTSEKKRVKTNIPQTNKMTSHKVGTNQSTVSTIKRVGTKRK